MKRITVETKELLFNNFDNKFILTVSGSRDWYDAWIVRQILSKFDPNKTILREGEAGGLDRIARDVALDLGFPASNIQRYPCTNTQWQQHGAKAGHLRNTKMIEGEFDKDLPPADGVIAFSLNQSRGTENAIETARKNNIPTYVFRRRQHFVCVNRNTGEKKAMQYKKLSRGEMRSRKGIHESYDVSSNAPMPLKQLSPFYSHRYIPIPGLNQGTDSLEVKPRYSDTVEGIWQGLKIIDGKIDATQFSGIRKKRKVDAPEIFEGWQYENQVLDVLEARRLIYIPSYFRLWKRIDDKLKDSFVEKAKWGREVQYFYDFMQNPNPFDPNYSFAHASLVCYLLQGRLDKKQLNKPLTLEEYYLDFNNHRNFIDSYNMEGTKFETIINR